MSQTAIESQRVFVCGSELQGQPDHKKLGDAKFVREAKTRPLYRLHSAADGLHPAIYEVAEDGVSILGEVYELTSQQFEHLTTTLPPNVYPSEVVLEVGEVLTGFLYPRDLVKEYNWPDISHYGGWVVYKTSGASA